MVWRSHFSPCKHLWWGHESRSVDFSQGYTGKRIAAGFKEHQETLSVQFFETGIGTRIFKRSQVRFMRSFSWEKSSSVPSSKTEYK